MANKYKQIIIPQEKKDEIINFFKTEKNNTIPIMVKKFGYSTYKIGRIINEYYESKRLKKCKK